MSAPITLGNIIGIAKHRLLVRVVPLEGKIHLNILTHTPHLENMGMNSAFFLV